LTTKVAKEELLQILRSNRDKHKSIFEEAQQGYREAVIKALDERLADARAGRPVILRFGLVQPTNQTKDYDRAIRMIEMSSEDTIKLEEDEFSNFVLDRWHWKKQWISSNYGYTKMAPPADDED
jgi:hypothetical protein